MPDYILKVSKPDERYCKDCPALDIACDECTSGYYICQELDENLKTDYHNKPLTPSNCPLVRAEEK